MDEHYWEIAVLPELLKYNKRTDLSSELLAAINAEKNRLEKLDEQLAQAVLQKKQRIKVLEHRLEVIKKGGD